MPEFNCTERSGVDCRSGAKRNVTAWARAKSKRMWDFVKRTLIFLWKISGKIPLWFMNLYYFHYLYELWIENWFRGEGVYIIYNIYDWTKLLLLCNYFVNIIIYYITRDARDNRRNSNFSTKLMILLEFFKMGIKSSLFIIHTWLVVYSQGEKWFDKMVLVC